MTYYIGIDPGLSGALSLIDNQGKYKEVRSIPIMANHKSTGRVKNCVNAKALYDIIISWKRFNPSIWLEHVGARQGDGVCSAFSFGDTFGSIRAVCSCAEIPINLVSPSVWKKYLKIGSDKEVARALAINLFPEACSELSRKKDHDRAEALLLAFFGYQQERII